jgi:FimV-like protein
MLSALDRAVPAERLLGRLTWDTTKTVWKLTLIPLVLIGLNAFRVQTCDVLTGLWYFLWLPMASAALSAGLGVACGAMVKGEWRWAALWPWVVVLGIVAWRVYRFYAAPPAFFYSILIGYFPGNLYDEEVALLSAFYWARAAQAFGVCGLLAACAAFFDPNTQTVSFRRKTLWTVPRKRQAAAAAVCLFAVLILVSQSSRLGITHDASDLARMLGRTHASAHAIIHFPAASVSDADVAILADDHDFRYAQVVRDLDVADREKISSFVFADPDAKFRAMGARNVHMAKPWRREIYLNATPFPHGTLRHEIAHIIAGDFGSSIFRISAKSVFGIPVFVNVGLIEGIAVAAAWPLGDDLTPHQSVKAIWQLGNAPPVSRLLSPSFFAFSGARSYTISGSFVRWLLDTRGPTPLKILYQTGGDFESAYGASETALIEAWQAFIQTVDISQSDVERVRERFRQKSIFARPCAHAVARWREQAEDAFVKNEFDQAASILQKLCREVPNEPLYWLDLAGVYTEAGDHDRARTILDGLASDTDHSSSVRAQALLDSSRLAAQKNNWPEVIRLLDQALTFPVTDDERRTLEIYREVAVGDRPAYAPLRVMLFDPKHDNLPARTGYAAIAVANDPQSPLAHYLLGRYLSGLTMPDAAAQMLKRALDLGLSQPLAVNECARLLAQESYRAGKLDWTVQAAAILLASPREIIQRRGADWLERVIWKQTGRVPNPALYQ